MVSKQLKYPQQLITSLISQIDPRLSHFFYTENKKYFEPEAGLPDIVNDTLKEYIKDETDKGELKNIQAVQVRMRRQKKNRWAKNIETNISKYDIGSKKNPFYNIHIQYAALSNAQFIQLYKYDNVDDVVLSCQEQITLWQKDSKQLLINYPLITSLTPKQVITAFKSDLIIDLIEIIITSLGGNIDSFLKRKPEVLIDNPFFAPAKCTVPLQKYFDQLAATLFQSNELEFSILRAHTEDDTENEDKNSIEVLDYMDNQILLALFTYIKPDFYESRQVFAYIGDLALSLHERPSTWHYQAVKRRLTRMSTVFFRYRYKNLKKSPTDQGLTFAFFDSALINSDSDGREYCTVTFSSKLYDAIIQKKMISVTSSNYNTLDKELSRLLYHSLQRERILLYHSSGPDENDLLYKIYDFSFFQRTVLFRKQRKAKNIALLKESLDEFQSKHIAIHHYIIDGDKFHIFYFSLSSDEKIDLLEDYGSVLLPDIEPKGLLGPLNN